MSCNIIDGLLLVSKKCRLGLLRRNPITCSYGRAGFGSGFCIGKFPMLKAFVFFRLKLRSNRRCGDRNNEVKEAVLNAKEY
mmetsp:Transcript_15927/g.17684  ORF Transcript_15927/g.17684 Transcript_15927/m.17684 type:complete len:81 (-) Transcript_15927:205-447(-)